MKQLKGAFKSKTVWFALALAILTWVQSVFVGAGLDQGELAIVGSIISGAIVWLRAITNEPLSNKGKK